MIEEQRRIAILSPHGKMRAVAFGELLARTLSSSGHTVILTHLDLAPQPVEVVLDGDQVFQTQCCMVKGESLVPQIMLCCEEIPPEQRDVALAVLAQGEVMSPAECAGKPDSPRLIGPTSPLRQGCKFAEHIGVSNNQPSEV